MNNDIYKLLIDDKVLFEPPSYAKQHHTIRGMTWYVPRLIEFAKLLEIKEIPINEVGAVKNNRSLVKNKQLTILELAYHLRLALEASTEWPIILGEDGRIMDGHHRVIKLLYEGTDSIRVTQFKKDPPPDVTKQGSTLQSANVVDIEEVPYIDFYNSMEVESRYNSRIETDDLTEDVLISELDIIKNNIAITDKLEITHMDLANYLKVIMELEDEPIIVRDNHANQQVVSGIPQLVKSLVIGNTYIKKINI